jgi:hypothetical protein
VVNWLIALLAGTVTGVLSAFGVGGGTLLVLYLTFFTSLSQTTAQGINLLYFFPASAASLPTHLKNGFLDKGAALPAIAAGVITTGLAAWAATGLDLELLRKCFGGYLLVIGLWELFQRPSLS